MEKFKRYWATKGAISKYEIYFDVTPFINWERGLEIKQWLLEHNRVEDYIILTMKFTIHLIKKCLDI